MVWLVIGLVIAAVGWLSVAKWYVYPKWRDTWQDGDWYLGD